LGGGREGEEGSGVCVYGLKGRVGMGARWGRKRNAKEDGGGRGAVVSEF